MTRAVNPLTPAAKRQIGKKIRSVREARGLGLDGLAQLAKMSSGSLGEIERGENEPTLGTLLRLVHGLELESIEELIGDVPPSMPSKTLSDGMFAARYQPGSRKQP